MTNDESREVGRGRFARAFLDPGPGVAVKICGITNREDALDAVAAGAGALGFNLYPGSKRFIELEREQEWIGALPADVARVAVLVNVPMDEALRTGAHPAIDLVQFHGDEDADYCAHYATVSRRPFIKALRLRDEATIAGADKFSTPHILLDADAGAAFGGAGALIDLALASTFSQRHPQLTLVLAGGLRVANVGDAVARVRPDALDVASGVEIAPRRKSREMMGQFVAAATRTTEN